MILDQKSDYHILLFGDKIKLLFGDEIKLNLIKVRYYLVLIKEMEHQV